MPVIEVNNFKKHFGKTKAVDGISFTVAKGDIFGFLGPNGAGKTTTIRGMMDFIRPTEGSIKILGLDSQYDSVELKKKIGYLSGQVNLYKKWTGQAHIDFVKKLHGDSDIADELVTRLDFDPTIKAKHLSSGNHQKLGLILSMMTKPEILIMDEPTLALDPLLQNEIYELLNEATQRGATVFMSSHNLSEVDRVCNRVGIIKDGKMVATESITDLKEKKINTVHAHFNNQFNVDEFLDANVQLVKGFKDGVILKVKGDINPLIKKLSNHSLRDINISQASLEDIFLEYYEN
ncbi:ABC transporter ATP-binding protein [Patescibacteria group bacterium]|nr:ABC transporter ATP-binding protein [Patescibacteria group bacterium]